MSTGTNLRGYLLVTLCYWVFTLSDGALRMLVLLHLHEQGETAWALALMLVPYEVAGVITNLLGGFVGARFGLKTPMILGLLLQALACALLSVDSAQLTIAYVMMTQVLSGVAKDLVKTSAKSYVKQLAPEHSSVGLFGLIAWMTGSKNTMKGLGFFLGGALLGTFGFQNTNWALATALAGMAVLGLWTVKALPGRPSASLAGMFRHDRSILWLSFARTFLFGSRDAWFAVALPLYLVSRAWSHPAVGGFLAAWVIVYGIVQAATPRIVKPASVPAGTKAVLHCTALLLLPLAATATLVWLQVQPVLALVVGLCAYGVLFAISSSLHSWLVVALNPDERTSERVGFYYAANALGRLLGTLASGWLFYCATSPENGLAACMLASLVAVIFASIGTAFLHRHATGPDTA
jgi:MFS family permease